MTEAEQELCARQCQGSSGDYCECPCDGANHGISYGGPRKAHFAPLAAAKGTKLCACGCGETTQRTYRPGHDARHHAAIKRQRLADELGITLEALPAAIKARKAEAAREKRAEKRAAQKELDARALAVVKSL